MKLPRFGVEEWLNVHEKEATYDIAGVSIASLSLEGLLDLVGQESSEFLNQVLTKTLDYGWIEGSPEFKEAVANLYQNQTSANVLQTNGATGANLLALYSLVEAGDHVISLYPTYQQLYDIPKSFGAEVDFWQIKEENNWLPDLDDLRRLIRPNTKMICINNANNPTGAVMDRAYLMELVAIAREADAYILSDEVYQTFSDELDVPAVCDLYEKGISVNSLSKTYSIPGVRVGWIVANEEITAIFKDYRDYTLICAGVFDDMVATLALQHVDKVLARNKAILHRHLSILEEWVNHEPMASFVKPAFVSTSFVKLAVEGPIEEFCLSLLKETGVLVVPGNRFEREGHVRIGYCCAEDTLRQGLEKLSQFLHQ